MFKMCGKYNEASIMIDSVDESTCKQIQGFLNHPAFGDSHIAIMPDCHAGKGSVVGFTMKLNDHIIPNVIGVDIGCGMLTTVFDIKCVDLKKFDEFIKTNIPAGFGSNQTVNAKFKNESKQFRDNLQNTCKKISLDYDRVAYALGTLGGGNHFIELGHNQFGKIAVTIHSGSRHFGKVVAEYHQNVAVKNSSTPIVRDLESLLVNSKEGQDYISDLRLAQLYASKNRHYMMDKISELFENPRKLQVIESVHNFIGDDDIIRKGATPAHDNQDVIIPFNMRDGLAICKGLGNSKYNFSAPHGAGRILSRSQAKKQLNVDEFVKKMKDAEIYSSTVGESTLDESPDAYKDMQVILDNIQETVKIVEMIKPIYNFKSA